MMSWEINQQKVFSELRNYKILSETCCFLSCYFYEGQKATSSKGRVTFVTNLKGIRSAVDFISLIKLSFILYQKATGSKERATLVTKLENEFS